MLGCALAMAWLLPRSPVATALVTPPRQQQVRNSGLTPGEKINAAAADDPQRLRIIETIVRDGRYDAAEPILRDYVQQYQESWRGHYDLGYVLFRLRGGKLSLADAIKESIQELSRSLVLNINNADAHKILALDLVIIQRQDLAEPELKQAERLDPASAEIHYFLGRHYMEQSNYAPAKGELEAAIRLDPSYMKAYENLGITLDRMGDGPAALTYYLKAVELNEMQSAPSEFPYLDLSRYYHDHSQIDLAESFALKALRRNPGSDQGYFELARNYRARGEWSNAEQALLKAVAINPRAAEYYYLLGLTDQRLGKRQESREAFANYAKYRDRPLPEKSEP
jgi:Flp pilus assembly protein TadD